MKIIELGQGTPLVFIPGLQGRCEYTRVTVDALATCFRVITFSLADEPDAQAPFDAASGFANYSEHVRNVLDKVSVDRAIVCGVSFGGLVALRFTAHFPNRVLALVLASTPGPGWHLKERHDMYARWPLVFGPLFMVEAPLRARAELRAALPRAAERWAFSRYILRTLWSAPISLRRMARRARRIAGYDAQADAAHVVAPTLVVTGEPGLDHVVDVDGSSKYAQLIAGAKYVVLRRTGHQGTLTRPQLFADEVCGFAQTLGQRARVERSPSASSATAPTTGWVA